MHCVEDDSSRKPNPPVLRAPRPPERPAPTFRKVMFLSQGRPIDILIAANDAAANDAAAINGAGSPLVVLGNLALLQGLLEQEARLGAKIEDAMLGVSRDGVVGSLIQALVKAADGTDNAHDDALRSIALALMVQALGRLREVAEEFLNAGRPSLMPKWRLKRVVEYVDAHLDRTISLTEMARVAGLTRTYFASQFRRTTGTSPHNFLLHRRIDKAKEFLRESDMPIVQVALTVGFGTQPHFTTVFKRLAGKTPHRWRQSQGVKLPRLNMRSAQPQPGPTCAWHSARGLALSES